jgi:AraC-like DNA-binding protein
MEYHERAKNETLRYSIFKGAVTLLLSAVAETNDLCPISSRYGSGDICDILLYINEHFTEDLTLNSLSERFGYSPQYFSRLFHRYMKVNLTEYINVARVNYAKKQLTLGKNVAEIAFESGFGSMPSFYRAYKKVFGELPRG